MLLWLLVVIVLTLVVLHFILNNSERARLLRKVPGPDYRFVVGNALQLFDTQVRLIGLTRKCTSQWPGIYRLWAFSIGVVNIYNVEDIELALSTKKFNEKSIIYDFLRPWLQDGLLISDGQKWHERRKILTPAFHFNILRRFFAVIQENSTKLVNSLTVSGEKLDIVPVISDFTLTALCETAMGTQFSDKMAEKGQAYKYAIYDLSKVLVERATRVILHPDFIFSFTSLYRRQCNSINTIKHFTQNVIKERQEYLELSGYETLEENEKDTNGQEFDMIPKRRRPAMLDLLLLAKKDGLIDDQGIQEEVDTLCASEWQVNTILKS